MSMEMGKARLGKKGISLRIWFFHFIGMDIITDCNNPQIFQSVTNVQPHMRSIGSLQLHIHIYLDDVNA